METDTVASSNDGESPKETNDVTAPNDDTSQAETEESQMTSAEDSTESEVSTSHVGEEGEKKLDVSLGPAQKETADLKSPDNTPDPQVAAANCSLGGATVDKETGGVTTESVNGGIASVETEAASTPELDHNGNRASTTDDHPAINETSEELSTPLDLISPSSDVTEDSGFASPTQEEAKPTMDNGNNEDVDKTGVIPTNNNGCGETLDTPACMDTTNETLSQRDSNDNIKGISQIEPADNTNAGVVFETNENSGSQQTEGQQQDALFLDNNVQTNVASTDSTNMNDGNDNSVEATNDGSVLELQSNMVQDEPKSEQEPTQSCDDIASIEDPHTIDNCFKNDSKVDHVTVDAPEISEKRESTIDETEHNETDGLKQEDEKGEPNGSSQLHQDVVQTKDNETSDETFPKDEKSLEESGDQQKAVSKPACETCSEEKSSCVDKKEAENDKNVQVISDPIDAKATGEKEECIDVCDNKKSQGNTVKDDSNISKEVSANVDNHKPPSLFVVYSDGEDSTSESDADDFTYNDSDIESELQIVMSPKRRNSKAAELNEILLTLENVPGSAKLEAIPQSGSVFDFENIDEGDVSPTEDLECDEVPQLGKTCHNLEILPSPDKEITISLPDASKEGDVEENDKENCEADGLCNNQNISNDCDSTTPSEKTEEIQDISESNIVKTESETKTSCDVDSCPNGCSPVSLMETVKEPQESVLSSVYDMAKPESEDAVEISNDTSAVVETITDDKTGETNTEETSSNIYKKEEPCVKNVSADLNDDLDKVNGNTVESKDSSCVKAELLPEEMHVKKDESSSDTKISEFKDLPDADCKGKDDLSPGSEKVLSLSEGPSRADDSKDEVLNKEKNDDNLVEAVDAGSGLDAGNEESNGEESKPSDSDADVSLSQSIESLNVSDTASSRSASVEPELGKSEEKPMTESKESKESKESDDKLKPLGEGLRPSKSPPSKHRFGSFTGKAAAKIELYQSRRGQKKPKKDAKKDGDEKTSPKVPSEMPAISVSDLDTGVTRMMPRSKDDIDASLLAGVVMRRKPQQARQEQLEKRSDQYLQQKIDHEIRMRDGTAKLLAASKHPQQMLEAAKNLLTSNSRMIAYMSELQRRKTHEVMQRNRAADGNQIPCQGKVAVSELRIPLMWKDSDHFRNKGDHRRYSVFCLWKIGTEIYDTTILKDVDRSMTDLSFEDVIIFNDIKPDFECRLEVYCHKLCEDLTIASTHRRIKKKFNEISTHVGRSVGKRLSGVKDESDFMSNMLVGPKFEMIANATLKLADITNSTATYDLVTDPSQVSTDGGASELPLYGHFCCRLVAQPNCMVKETASGFLRVKDGSSWEKHWCQLKEMTMSCYDSPAGPDSGKKPNLKVSVKKNTQVLRGSPGSSSGQDFCFQISSSSKFSKTQIFAADSEAELERWWQALQQSLLDLALWQHACDENVELPEVSTHRQSSYISRNSQRGSLYEETPWKGSSDDVPDSPMSKILARLNVCEEDQDLKKSKKSKKSETKIETDV